MALGAGYRCDFALNEFQDQTFRQTIEADIRQEAFLYQVDRNKLTTAMAMPRRGCAGAGLQLPGTYPGHLRFGQP